jgi:hypothetical protein
MLYWVALLGLQVYLQDLFNKQEFALNLQSSILKEAAVINR